MYYPVSCLFIYFKDEMKPRGCNVTRRVVKKSFFFMKKDFLNMYMQTGGKSSQIERD